MSRCLSIRYSFCSVEPSKIKIDANSMMHNLIIKVIRYGMQQTISYSLHGQNQPYADRLEPNFTLYSVQLTGALQLTVCGKLNTQLK